MLKCLFLLLIGCTTMASPIAEKKPQTLNIHEKELVDDYHWLKNKDSKEVLDYLKLENEHFEKVMTPVKGLQEELFAEMKSKVVQKDKTVPFQKENFKYYVRYEEGLEYPIYCREANEQESVILDVNELAKGFDYFKVADWDIDVTENKLAYTVDTKGDRKYTLYVKNLITGEVEDSVAGVSPTVVWSNDTDVLFYVKIEPTTLRDYEVYLHRLNDANDKLIYKEDDDTFDCGIYKSASKRYLFVGSYQRITSEVWYLDLSDLNSELKLFEKRNKGHEYFLEHNDKFYVQSNKDGINFGIYSVENGNWNPLIPHNPDYLISSYQVFDKFLAVEMYHNGLTEIHCLHLDTNQIDKINFKEDAYLTDLGINEETNTTKLRYNYTSMTTPNSVFEYDVNTKESTLLKQSKVNDETFSPDNYQTKRIYATAEDGVKVPISLVYKKDKFKGNNPLLLYGYGSYGITIDPVFSISRLSLLDRGFVFAIAHIRGGQELGRKWYEDGKMFKKQNTFSDFISCAKHLISENYTSSDKLYATGGSAGGLLMGAVINQSPETFNGIVAAVPFVDVINTMLDASLPLTTGEYDEWGNPNNKDSFEYILQYSPYENVKSQKYPHLMVTTGYNDSQVGYWEPAKWVAKLRELKTDNNLLVFKTEMEVGHQGLSGRFKAFKDVADTYAFFLGLENKLL